jgi:hypothetical protein
MKIKIVEPGNESYTGYLGNVQFFGGVSTHDVSEPAAQGIAAIYRIERIGDDVEEQVQEVTSTGQEDAQTDAKEDELTSEEQKDAQEGAQTDTQDQEQVEQADAKE